MLHSKGYDQAAIGLNVRRESEVKRVMLIARLQAAALAVGLVQFALCFLSLSRTALYPHAVRVLLFALAFFCASRICNLASFAIAVRSPTQSGTLGSIAELGADLANLSALLSAFIALWCKQLIPPGPLPLFIMYVMMMVTTALAIDRPFYNSVTFNTGDLLDPTVSFETFLCAIIHLTLWGDAEAGASRIARSKARRSDWTMSTRGCTCS